MGVFLEKKNCLKKILIYAIIIFLSSSLNSFPAYASSLMGIEDQFDGLSGNAKYAGKEYRDNYRLDIEPLGLTEAGAQIMADFGNGIWMAIYNFAFLAIAVFYHALSLDFAKLLADQIQTIQAALHDSVFQPLLMIAIIGTFSIIVLKYARRDFSGLIGEFGKILFIMILSVWLVKDSASLLSGATNITKGLSTSVLSELANVDVGGDVGGIKLGDGTELYAQQASGVLWVSLIHQSWLSLEFGNYKPSEEEVEQFLTAETTDKREELVKKVMEDNPKVFSKDRTAGRIAQAFIMLILIAVKSCIYGALAVLQIFLQVIAIACVLLAAFILFLALIPSYGFDILGIWVKKIFETQLAMLLITFLMGFMILISNIISSISGSLGWMVGLVLEVAIGVGLFKFRSQLFSMFATAGKFGKMVAHPSALKHSLEYGISPSDFYPGSGGDGPFRRNRRSSRYQNENDYDDYQDESDDYQDDSDDSGNNSKSTTNKPVTYNQEAAAVQPQEESGSYYATYEDSSNWRDQWYGAARPTTESEKSMRRAPIKADSSPDLENKTSETVSDNQAEGMQRVKRPVSVQALQEVEIAEDGQQMADTQSSVKTVRPVIGQDLQERERTGQKLQSRLDGDAESVEFSPEEYIKERPRINAEQLQREVSPGERYDSGLEREGESQDYSPEEYTRERPRIEEAQIYEKESPGERYDDRFESDAESQDHSPEEYTRERPRTEEEQINEGAATDRRSENNLEVDAESSYLTHGTQEISLDMDNSKSAGVVEEWNQERPRIEDTSEEMEKGDFQEPTIRPQSIEEGVDDENHTRIEKRPETQNMASREFYSGEAAEGVEENKTGVVRPNMNEELAVKQSELAQESVPDTSARENTAKEETSHTEANSKGKGKEDKKDPKDNRSKRRLLPKKQVEVVNKEEEES